ncbi:hypothetical protein [Jannaschia formosa]|uniref:hypothetical protein n=1 Tax=Jannaschia formosa TaxID=2259592 RepID=UPI000E1BD4E3|nr:hypothetical protein [Jannaschia formosa]TFL20133.1 hypothetical protein DR046_01945 [Jannaschia formosa]
MTSIPLRFAPAFTLPAVMTMEMTARVAALWADHLSATLRGAMDAPIDAIEDAAEAVEFVAETTTALLATPAAVAAQPATAAETQGEAATPSAA